MTTKPDIPVLPPIDIGKDFSVNDYSTFDELENKKTPNIYEEPYYAQEFFNYLENKKDDDNDYCKNDSCSNEEESEEENDKNDKNHKNDKKDKKEEKKEDKQIVKKPSRSKNLGEELDGAQKRIFENALRYFIKLICEDNDNVEWIRGQYGYGRWHLVYCSDTLNECVDCKENHCKHMIDSCMKCGENVCGSCQWVGQLAVKDRYLKSRLTEIVCCKKCTRELIAKGKRNKFDKSFDNVFHGGGNSGGGFGSIGRGISSGLDWIFGH
jgi:hypothetical protein